MRKVDIVDGSCGNNNSTLIPKDINIQDFSMGISLEERNIKQINMLHYDGEYKGAIWN